MTFRKKKPLSDEEKYKEKLKKIEAKNQRKLYAANLKAERNKYKRKMETSKVLASYLFALLNIIVFYSMFIMDKYADISSLGVLITDIAAQILVYAIYCLKAFKAKNAEETLKFEKEKYTGSLGDILRAGADSTDEPTLQEDEYVDGN